VSAAEVYAARATTSTGKVHAIKPSNLAPACGSRIIAVKVEALEGMTYADGGWRVTCATCLRVLGTEPIETPEYAAMVRRVIRRYGERVGDADPVDLTTMVEISREFDHAVRVAVRGLRAAGFTWREIGEALGTSKEAALMRFRETPKPRPVAGDLPGQTSILDALEEVGS
jgi:hypothetical protein